MTEIPFDIVNYICELAAGNDKLWYPFFSPKTGIVTWKLNKNCKKTDNIVNKLVANKNNMINGCILLFNNNTFDSIEGNYKLIYFMDELYNKMYIEIKNEEDEKYAIRGMFPKTNGYIKINGNVYLNGTMFATTPYGPLINNTTNMALLGYEPY